MRRVAPVNETKPRYDIGLLTEQMSVRGFLVGHCATAVAVDASGPESVSSSVEQMCAGLLELFAGASDGRSDQDGVHPVAMVLARWRWWPGRGAIPRSLAGLRMYATAVEGVVYACRCRADAVPMGPPSKATIWRVVTDAEVRVFDAAAR
jgi:hypothetical protein